MDVTGSTISGDGADGGGGIYLSDGCSAVIGSSRVTGNSSGSLTVTGPGSEGGGVAPDGASLVLIRSTVDDDTAGSGGGISARNSQLTVETSTIAENTGTEFFGGSGGGLSLDGGYAFLANSTVTGNRVGRYRTNDVELSGGIGADGRLSLADTVVAGNFQGDTDQDRTASDIAGTIAASNGHDIFGSNVAGNVSGDVEGAKVGIGELSDDGGPTPTVGLVGFYSGADLVAAGTIDQRGFFRPIPGGTNPDVGALESAAPVSRTANSGNNVLTGTFAADTLDGLAGAADLILARGGGDTLNGGAGGDTLIGGFGPDRLDGDAGQDTASYRDATGAAGTDSLRELENLEGGRFADALTGSAVTNWIDGLDGGARLLGLGGSDVLRAGGGNDRPTGGEGRDRLEGGFGNDVFDFDRLADRTSRTERTTADVITDFARPTDRIDLATVDAGDATAGVNEAFTFLAGRGAAFTGAGQVRWFQGNGSTFLEASVDADTAPELQIQLAGLTTLGSGDFVL